jgi:hypothetical protein
MTKDISTNTFDLVANYDQKTNLKIQKAPLAEISKYIIDFSEKIL